MNRQVRQPGRSFWRRARRGQAMVEYSILNGMVAFILLLGLTSPVIPAGASEYGGNRNLIQLFLEAYQAYYDSYYFVLNLPFP